MVYDVVVVGGGLGGLCSALHLSRKGLEILLLEKHAYPRHKVCGEYISNEVLPYLKSLGFDPFEYGAKPISSLILSTPKSRSIQVDLPLGGFGISRYCMDAALAKKAQEAGVKIVHQDVTEIEFENEAFTVRTQEQEYTTPLVVGAFGKRSNLDVQLDRKFIKKKSPYLGVKAHYNGDFPEDCVGLHNFEGGYCGVSKIENDHINICYLVNLKSFKRYKNLEAFELEVVRKNDFLKTVLTNAEMLFDNPLTISQVSFDRKCPVKNHVLMCGDSAGLIHPLAGNGMSMAIRAAQIVSSLIVDYKAGKINSRFALEQKYKKRWNKEFNTRLRFGRTIARLFRLGFISECLMVFLKAFPFLVPPIIKRTHGKPMTSID